MPATFVPITTSGELAEWRRRSADRPVLVFKHDPGCVISSFAYQQLRAIDEEIPVIDVAHDRAFSLAVAAETDVRHESPQVILFRDGEPVWSASHFAIKTDTVRRALAPDE